MTQELILRPMTMRVPYNYPAGIFGGDFLKEIRDNAKIYANKCPKCGLTVVSPRAVCPMCTVRMENRDKWIEVGPKGTVLTFSVLEQPFYYPPTGEMTKVPFALAHIQLDGAPVVFNHELEETDPEKIWIGMRVEAVFKPKEERRARIQDIIHFRTISE